MFFTFFFVSCVFLYFSLSKAASCSRYTHFHSSKLEFVSNLGSENSAHYYGAYQLISLLNLPNSATNILYHSLARSFSSAILEYMLWLDYGIFKLISLIASYTHCLFFFDHGKIFVEDWQYLTGRLWIWSSVKIWLCSGFVDLSSVIC